MMGSTPDTMRALVEAGEAKATAPTGKLFILGILAGAYIGFGAHLATVVSTGTWQIWGLQRVAVGAAFTLGLMLVVVAGAELFTGNNLMTMALCARRIGACGLLRNWAVVYMGNLVGSVGLALVIAKGSGLLAGPAGGTAINIAASKISAAQIEGINHNLAFFFRGIGCNWLVCLAVLMATASKSASGKFLGIFFPIMAFVASGFEHCVANMYFIPAGIFAKGFAAACSASGLGSAEVSSLTWGSMWTQNLVSVTLGNVVGGALFVGAAYFLAHLRDTEVSRKEISLVAPQVRRAGVMTAQPPPDQVAAGVASVRSAPPEFQSGHSAPLG